MMKTFLLIFAFILISVPAFAAEAPVSALDQSENELARAHESLVGVLPKRARNEAYAQQVGWFKFRNATCDLEGKAHEKPSDASKAVIDCTVRMNRQRISKLNEMRRIFIAASK